MPKGSLQRGWEGNVAERKLGSRGKKMARSRHVAIHLWVYHIYSMSDVSHGLMEMAGCVFNGIKYMVSFIFTFRLPNEELDIQICTFQSMVGSARYISLNSTAYYDCFTRYDYTENR